MKKTLTYILIFIAILLSSCTSREEGEHVLNIAYSQDIPSLDVMKSNNRALRDMLVGHVYERLFILDEEGSIVPELAEGYTLENDNRTLKVKLREDVAFHDGSIMKARDAAASLNRWISSYRDASRMTGDNRFTVEGEYEIRIDSVDSLLFFPYLLASSPFSAVIMPERIASNVDGFVHDIIGTGPYEVESYLSGDKLILSRFEDYVPNENGLSGIAGEKHGYADRIIYNIVPDAVTRRIGLERGQYDHINDVMSQDIPLYEKNDDIVIYGGEESGSIALVFNRKSTDDALRKAISLSLDPESLMKACYGDYGYSLHKDLMEKGSPFCFMVPSDSQDREKAIEIVRENGLEKKTVRILSSNLSNLDRIAVEMAEELRSVGLEPEITVYDWAGFIDKRREGNFDIMVSAFSSVPLPNMKVYLSSTYPGWYESEESEEYLGMLSNAGSFNEAVEIWKEAQEFYFDDMPVLVPGHYISLHAGSDDVEGVIYTDGAHFWNARKSGW